MSKLRKHCTRIPVKLTICANQKVKNTQGPDRTGLVTVIYTMVAKCDCP